MMEYWHNPRCSKSREALALLREKGVEPEIREYLKNPPSAAELKNAVKKLNLGSPRDLMRTKEAEYSELGLNDETDSEKLIEAMSKHPRLIERPVLINGPKAAIGRPPADILDAL